MKLDLSRDPVEYEIHECTGGREPVITSIPRDAEDNVWTICLGKAVFHKEFHKKFQHFMVMISLPPLKLL